MSEKSNLRYLRALVAVVEAHSIAKAAERLLRAPSAVARSLRELEEELQTHLFERGPQGMTANALGQAVYGRAKRIEHELTQARSELVPMGAPGTAHVFAMMAGVRQLQILAKLRELGHMPSVAESVGVSQPAVSAALQAMESSLSLPLFRRSPRGMSVTEAGELLLFRVRRVLTELRHLEADILRLRGVVAGRVTLAARPSSRTLLLPQAIARLVTRHPQVQVSVVDAPFEILFSDVQSGEIDVILTGISPEYRHKDFRIEVIGHDHLEVVVRAGHPLTARRDLAVHHLLDYPWVLRDHSAPSRQLINQGFERMGAPAPHVAVQAGDLGVLRGLLLRADFVSAVSPQHLHYELASGSLVRLPLPLGWSEREIGFVLRRDAQPSALCHLLMDEVRAVAREGGSGHGDRS